MTAILGYVTLNTIFRYHFSFDRVMFAGVLVFFATIIWYRGTDKQFEFLLTVGIEFTAILIIKYVTYRKHNFGYFLFNVYRKEYDSVHKEILETALEFEIDRNNICHKRKKPFLVVVRNEDSKKVAKMFKTIDKAHIKAKKTFTMYNYWFLVAFIAIEVIIWRF